MPAFTAADDTAWNTLAVALGAQTDRLQWLHATLGQRRFSLTRMHWGHAMLVVAHCSLDVDETFDAIAAVRLSAGIPLGAIVHQGGAWLLRHAFLGIPAPDVAREVLEGLAVTVQVPSRSRTVAPCASLSHYVD